jgi:hypothetical protein
VIISREAFYQWGARNSLRCGAKRGDYVIELLATTKTQADRAISTLIVG